MEPENKCEDVEDVEDDADMDEGVSFSQVSKVVTGWTMDFLFASLCRLFKEGKLDEFEQTLSTIEGKTDRLHINMLGVQKTQSRKRKNSRVNNDRTTNYERFENALGVILGFSLSETDPNAVKLSFAITDLLRA